MLKYKLKKGVSLKVGMTFRYNSNEELKALANALDVYDKIPSSQSTLRHDGFLIIKGYNNEETNYFQIEKVMFSKYLTKSTEYLVKKKDFFKKIKDIDTEVIDKELKSISLANAKDIDVDESFFSKEIIDRCKETLKKSDEKGIVHNPPLSILNRDNSNNITQTITNERDKNSVVKVFENPIKDAYYITIYVPSKDLNVNSFSSYCVAATFKISDGYKCKLVCEAVYKHKDQKLNDDVAINMALYYNSKLLPETNLPHILSYVKDLGLEHILEKSPKLSIAMLVKYQSSKYDNGVYVYPIIKDKYNLIVSEILLLLEDFDSSYLSLEIMNFNQYSNYISMLAILSLYIKEIQIRKVLDKCDKDYKSIGVNSLERYGIRDGLYSNDNTKDLSVLERLASLRNDLVQNKQYEIASEIRDIESRLRTSHRNSSVVSKGIICGTFKVDTIDHNDSTSVNRQETNVKNTGVQDFFDMLYKNKIAVVSKDESNTEYKKDISNICSVAYLNYIYRGLEVVKYIDGSVVLLIPPSDKHTAIDLKLLKDYILEQDIKKVNYDHIVNQYKSVGYGYSIEELKDENGIIKKYLIKPDGSKMIIE